MTESRTSSLTTKLAGEAKAVGLASLYFGTWFLVLLVLKSLILAEYQIRFRGFSAALLGALILSKVVLVLEHVPLGTWLRQRPALVHVLVRTALYGLGVLVVLLLEKAFEARHEHSGFLESLRRVFQHRDMPHVLAAAIGVTGALLGFNMLAVVRQHLGGRGLLRVFLSPLPRQGQDSSPSDDGMAT